MMRFISTIVLIHAPLVLGAFTINDDQLTKEKMVSHLDILKNTFEVMYGPAHWKKEYAGWDLDVQIEYSKKIVLSSDKLTLKKYQRIIRDFLNSTKDYHVGAVFHSTEAASLPFGIKGAEGRYFFSYIDRDRLSSSAYPFNVGDELVSFDGKPTEDVINEIKTNELSQANTQTDQDWAELLLTNRMGKTGMYVPKGPLKIGVKHKGNKANSSYQIIWDYIPEKIKSHFQLINSTSLDQGVCPSSMIQTAVSKQLLTPRFNLLAEDSHEPKDPHRLGARESFVPPLGPKIWETNADNPFYAYLFEDDDERIIGYIRISQYKGGDEEAKAFGEIIEKFEETTDALIIDQVNNPGGLVFYMYALASMLTDQPLETPRHRMKITQQDVAQAVELLPLLDAVESDDDARELIGETLQGYPVNYQVAKFILSYFQFIIDEWNEGRTFTEAYYLFGVDQINPHPEVRYTKPFVTLINSSDFSCGDFFPAIFQDNKRSLLFGTKTAGAGGYVMGWNYPNLFGIEYIHYTGSLAERADKSIIENLAITPDVVCEVTIDDLQNNFSSYASTLLRALKEIY